MSNAAPTLRVEIDFSGTPWNSDQNVWTDVTEYVQELDPQRGRDNEIGSIEAGTMNLTLDNSDGRFTPKLSTSPYYPWVKPRRPIRVVATWASQEYPIFRGVTGRFPATTIAGHTDVTIECTDPTTPLSEQPINIPYIQEITAKDPADKTQSKYGLVELFPMNDGPNRFAGLVDPANNHMLAQPAITNAILEDNGANLPVVTTQATDILPNGTGQGSAQVTGTTKKQVGTSDGRTPTLSSGIAFVSTPFELNPTATGGDFAVNMWFRPTHATVDMLCVFRIEEVTTGTALADVFLSTGIDFYGYVKNYTRGSGEYHQFFFSNVPDNDPYFEDYTKLNRTNQITLQYGHDQGSSGGPAIGLFINGDGLWTDLTASGDNGAPFIGATNRYRIVVGSPLHQLPPAYASTGLMGCDFQVEMISLHNKVLGNIAMTQLALAAEGWGDQDPANRINTLLDMLDWPDTFRNLDPTPETTRIRYLAWDGAQSDAVEQLRAPANDDNGLFFFNAAGEATYQSRLLRVNPTPKFTFTESAGTGAEAPLNWEMSEDDITNVAQIDNAYGIKTTVRNEDSIAEFGEKSVSLSTRLVDDAEAVQAGYWRVNRFGDAQLRLDEVVLNPTAQRDGLLWLAVLSMELSDCIRIDDLPANAPDAVTDYFVEKIQHEISRNGETLEWLTTLQVSPATGYEGWILGDPELSVLGSTTILHY